MFYSYLYPAKCCHMVSAHKMLKESWIQINSKLTLLDANAQCPEPATSLGRYNSQTSTDHNGHIINTPLVDHSGWSAKTQLIATSGLFQAAFPPIMPTLFSILEPLLKAWDLTQVSPHHRTCFQFQPAHTDFSFSDHPLHTRLLRDSDSPWLTHPNVLWVSQFQPG